MLNFAIPIGGSFTGKIPFSDINWDDFVRYQAWKNMLRYQALPWDIALKEAEAGRTRAQTRALEEQALLSATERAYRPYEAYLQQARATALLKQFEPIKIPGDLMSKLISYLGLESLFVLPNVSDIGNLFALPNILYEGE